MILSWCIEIVKVVEWSWKIARNESLWKNLHPSINIRTKCIEKKLWFISTYAIYNREWSPSNVVCNTWHPGITGQRGSFDRCFCWQSWFSKTWVYSHSFKQWNVYAKMPFGSVATVVEYLGRYTHKVAITKHRLTSITKSAVVFNPHCSKTPSIVKFWAWI